MEMLISKAVLAWTPRSAARGKWKRCPKTPQDRPRYSGVASSAKTGTPFLLTSISVTRGTMALAKLASASLDQLMLDYFRGLDRKPDFFCSMHTR
jgi:hypothetical protein